MNTRLTIEQLEQMKTHELADLLANVVLLLRRMPDVECGQLTQIPDIFHLPELPAASPAQPQISDEVSAGNTTRAEDLRKKTVPELKKIATELHVSYTGKTKKDELINKIQAKQAHGHSEQYTIQHL